MAESSSIDFDIIICGGGLIGASLACALEESGLKIALIESATVDDDRQPSFDARMLALTYSAKSIYARLGLWERFSTADVTPISEIEVQEQGSRVTARLTADDIACEALGWNVASKAIGRCLYERLNRIQNFEMLAPASALQVKATRDFAQVEIEMNGKCSRLRAALAIIADGGRSSLCEQAGFEIQITRYAQNAMVCQLELYESHHGVAYETFTRRGPIAQLPVRSRECALVWTHDATESESLTNCSEDSFIERLHAELAAESTRFVRITNGRTVYPLTRSWLRTAAKERVVAVGNAAHTVHPVAGQGLNLSLREISALADVISINRKRGWDIGSLSVLNQYERGRNAEGRAVSAFTDGLIRFFASDRLPVRMARRLGILGVRAYPPARRYMLRRTAGLRSMQRRPHRNQQVRGTSHERPGL